MGGGAVFMFSLSVPEYLRKVLEAIAAAQEKIDQTARDRVEDLWERSMQPVQEGDGDSPPSAMITIRVPLEAKEVRMACDTLFQRQGFHSPIADTVFSPLGETMTVLVGLRELLPDRAEVAYGLMLCDRFPKELLALPRLREELKSNPLPPAAPTFSHER